VTENIYKDFDKALESAEEEVSGVEEATPVKKRPSSSRLRKSRVVAISSDDEDSDSNRTAKLPLDDRRVTRSLSKNAPHTFAVGNSDCHGNRNSPIPIFSESEDEFLRPVLLSQPENTSSQRRVNQRQKDDVRKPSKAQDLVQGRTGTKGEYSVSSSSS
jgi:hypothetical protein